MASAIGWYGPLIDLCKASSYIGDYVQLLVFVHKFTPIQYKIGGNGGEVVRMDVLVGDETRSYFPVTIWQKHMRSLISAGHVFLLQNLKITRYGDTVEARALHCSSLQCLLQPDDFVASKGLDKLIGESRVGVTVKDKLQKVAGWLQRAKLVHCGSVLNYNECRRQVKVNWKLHEEICTQDCSSLSELWQCEDSCKATVHASVGEIFLPITWANLREPEAERMFISRRLHTLGENSLVDDLTTTGCQECGIPVNDKLGSSVEQSTIPLYCQRSSNRLHVIGGIYRPFLVQLLLKMRSYTTKNVTTAAYTYSILKLDLSDCSLILQLYVWDDSKYLPIYVTNNAAELLFGNIPAEKVISSYRNHRSITDKTLQIKDKGGYRNPNFFKIWLILLNMMFQHGKNSPFKFKVTVDTNRDWENGRLEMVSVSLPAFTGTPSV